MAKTDKFAKYFGQTPNLKEAQKRTKEMAKVEYNSHLIPDRIKKVGVGKKYYIRTYGCQMNEHDTEVMAGILEEMGYEKTNTPEDATVVLLNTCAIRDNAEQKVFGFLGELKRYKRSNPEMILGVSGCMSQEEEVVNKILAKYQHVDLIMGTHNIHRLPQILEDAIMSKEMIIDVWSKEGDIIENLPKVRDNKVKAWINIMYGCDKFCTYCIVPYTRGKERSRMPEDVLKEIQELKDQGYLEVTLLGQNVNAYGKDLNINYTMGDLLRDVAKIGIPRIKYTSSHPWDFDDHMINIIAEYDNIVPHVHLPVQAGNNEVLKIMGRSYTREEYLELFDKLKAKMPDAGFTTDIIVGYPNETEEQFQDTLSLYEHCQYDSAYTFVFSPREGTPAAKMNDNVSKQEKKDRLQRLNRLVEKYSRINNEKYVGKTLSVLVEGVSKNNDQMLVGYSNENKLVHFPGSTNLTNTIQNVKINDFKTWTLYGEIIS